MKFKVLVMSLLSVATVFGKFRQVPSEKSFIRLVNKYPYSVVCFAQSKPEDKDVDRDEKREIRDDFKDFKEIVKAASDAGDYGDRLDKEVGFFLVDVVKRQAEEIDDQFGLQQFPICMLFKEGKPIGDMGHWAQIYAPIYQASILDLLDKYFKKEFEALIKEKKEQERLDREERIARYEAYARWGGPYGRWGWGYTYPYYGYGYGYGLGWGPRWRGYGYWW